MGILVAASLSASIVRLVPGLVGPVLVYCDWVDIRVALLSISLCGSTHSIVEVAPSQYDLNVFPGR